MQRSLRLSSLIWATTALVACNSIVGIDDLYEDGRPGTGGTESSAGDGGTTSAGASGSGDSGGMSEPTEGGSGSEPLGGGGAGPGPEPIGGQNAGGAPEPGGSTVAGHVIDFWGHKLANVPVRIGDAVTSTDDDGAFVFEDVPATYDISFVAEYLISTVPRTWAWYYHGLTRRDPTLQANLGMVPSYGKLDLTPQNAVLGPNQTISVAVGGVDGNNDFPEVATTNSVKNLSWEGGSTTNATAHGLQWQRDAATKLPTSYVAYDSTPVGLSENATPKISLDFSPETIDSAVIEGTVTPVTDDARYNEVYLQFTSGTTLRLISEVQAPNTFSYLVPSLPGSTLTVLATEGDYEFGPYSIARASGLAPSANPSLVLPKAVELTGPGNDTQGVTTKTNFTFQSAASNPGPFVVQIENADVNGPNATLFIVTAEKKFTIPEKIAADFALHADNYFEWRVATHGKLGSVDAMTGPEGFLQPFDLYNEVPHGPRQADGEYSLSTGRLFTTP